MGSEPGRAVPVTRNAGRWVEKSRESLEDSLIPGVKEHKNPHRNPYQNAKGRFR
jgi:hypothetical protein